MIDDGGPAFPINPDAGWGPCDGMSLLDWFAAQAMKSVNIGRHELGDAKSYALLAKVAYQLAQAMLAARKRLMEAQS